MQSGLDLALREAGVELSKIETRMVKFQEQHSTGPEDARDFSERAPVVRVGLDEPADDEIHTG
jgi:hypothetical protein